MTTTVTSNKEMVVAAAASGGGRRCVEDDACRICGWRSHNESFCVFNYMDGYFSSRSCREQCKPGWHRHAAAAADDFDADEWRRCFVRVTNVAAGVEGHSLRWLFQRFGPVRACSLSREGQPAGDGDGGGLAFVTFYSGGDAEAAVEGLNGHLAGDRRLRVDLAYPRVVVLSHHA
ncbi:uncharacterized protein [Oryza sativa Japonica Group]|uniref:Os12g0606300 protein n=4 Tax=Oryza TaxID=4527 RepID=Q2QMF6_ORYSJ|nr:CUGBP Elav-like family member 6 [Oryza sativa Japonica Group]EEC69637.1 hypothetical protein OsI_39033 [Oryza sativa Indica Group]ABA99839.1 RNA recognition motif family protein [Oryza sativa Japonica Group]EEE53569.1 hypothetical protein OsJ_36799 [Oryza sativa Japonica Group]KAF2908726.1 hypothetical protein DAI22_12g204400 [Oryza sativa Japonica Group]BAT17992.1 Os12g0606300 [Oryza sativa Japonica Group]